MNDRFIGVEKMKILVIGMHILFGKVGAILGNKNMFFFLHMIFIILVLRPA